ncbi:MAG: hypothetical protein A2176_13000 [Spirochaetes bacterium RBG_13_51_14]|nr:MAG: hypothetical protein A2176_13000 [Spirochaetes bacterium RBG_13_51_14]
MVRLKGLRAVTSFAACNGCGLCVDNCFTRALSVHEGKLLRNDSRCKGCGRCAAVCPEKAITLEVDDVAEAVKDIMGRIEQRVSID